MHFVALCLDKPGALAVRLENREAHLAFIAEKGPAVRLGGPFLDAEGRMCGSMIIYDCPSEAAVRAMVAEDPYVKAGLFASVELRAFRPVVGVSLA